MAEQQTSSRDQAIAQRAYEKWEAEGRPEGRAESHWREAAEELRTARARGERTTSEASETAADAPEPFQQSDTEITNTERALPPAERRRARAARHQSEAPSPSAEAGRMSAPHFVVTLDRAHVRIYRTSETGGPSGMQLQLEHSVDLPEGKQSYTARDTDQAGQFAGRGMDVNQGSIDERLPMQREHHRRLADELAAQVDSFLRRHPQATWDFAAGPALHQVVLENLSPETRRRLGTAVPKDLVNQSIDSWREHFAPEQKKKPQRRGSAPKAARG